MQAACRSFEESPDRSSFRAAPRASLGALATAPVLLRAERAPAVTSAAQTRREALRMPCIEMGMRVALWALQRRAFPTPEEIRDHFGVNRATAYRYRARLADLLGVEPPPGGGV